MFYLISLIGVAFALQIILSCRQMKAFSREFVALRRKGKVVCGRKAGGFRAGAIVMFLVDDKGIILEGKKMEGITVLARVKDLPGYQGRYIGDLTAADGPHHHHNLCKALADAALS